MYNLNDKKTIFLIGNGPSLNKVDVTKLKDQKTISFNRAYIAYEEWGFEPTYYLIIDKKLIATIYPDVEVLIKTSSIKNFFIINHSLIKVWLNDIKEQFPDKIYILNRNEDNDFTNYKKNSEINNSFFGMLGNAGPASIQLLYLMGYERVILIGCDASYFPENINDEKDLNHFRSDYFDKNNKNFLVGREYGYPSKNSEEEINLWNIIKNKIKDLENFEIISSTPDSILNDLFEFVDFYKWFKI